MEGDLVLLLLEGDVDLEDFNDVIEMLLFLFLIVIFVFLVLLMMLIFEFERYWCNVFGVSICMYMFILIYVDIIKF